MNVVVILSPKGYLKETAPHTQDCTCSLYSTEHVNHFVWFLWPYTALCSVCNCLCWNCVLSRPGGPRRQLRRACQRCPRCKFVVNAVLGTSMRPPMLPAVHCKYVLVRFCLLLSRESDAKVTRLKWSDDDMLAAISVSITEASRKHQVPRKILDNQIKNKVVHGTRPGPSTALTEEEEGALVSYLVYMAQIPTNTHTYQGLCLGNSHSNWGRRPF